ncbi:hypothetical protein [Clostridium tagluense]|uniref:hypothetical protein n=1 Tax=Clostridium tagluense TaxID=360422 RepID=UPI001CF2203B|nr:hypothetical protein [Clostridium tagluense]MCB2299598.1 hypothetical protein [Clostridium tagluense]
MKKFKKKLITLLLALILPLTFMPKEVYATNAKVIDGGISIIGIVTNFLSSFYPSISKAIVASAINNGDYLEFISFAPPDFDQDKFCISMYDGINPTNSTMSYRIKVYSQTNAKNPVEVTLKSGQRYSLTANNDTPELYFEFFNGNETTPFERYCLPMEYHNKNFGIALGSNKKVYYLQKETNRVFNDDMMLKIFNRSFNYDQVYNNLSQADKQKHDPYIFRKTKAVSKATMSRTNCVDNQSILKEITYYQNYVPKPFFRESFENNALLGWNCYGNVQESYMKSWDQGFSLMLSGDVSYIYKTFSEKPYKAVSMQFYDDASVTSAKVVGRACGDNFQTGAPYGSVSIGVDTEASKDYYVFFINGGGAYITDIPRSTGWHKLTWTCVSNVRTDIMIDNKVVYNVEGPYLSSIKTVVLGDWWADGNDCMNRFFFDTVEAYN